MASILSGLLLPLSAIYRMVYAQKIASISPEKLPVPVICVGNIVVGGAGKTPTVIALVNMLKERGKKPHVISRGYKGRLAGPVRVDVDKHSFLDVGDEPLLIARHAPCWVARRRVEAALAAIADGADIIVMDDGLQNPSIYKDYSIMVVDGGFGFGNSRILPAGPLREPISFGLLKSEFVLVLGEDKVGIIDELSGKHDNIISARLKVVDDVKHNFAGRKLLAFAGIGRPQKFYDSLQEVCDEVGADIVATRDFPDHHIYSDSEIERLCKEAQNMGATLVTTEKDFVRLPHHVRSDVLTLPVTVEKLELDLGI